jgi:hypothetical protein
MKTSTSFAAIQARSTYPVPSKKYWPREARLSYGRSGWERLHLKARQHRFEIKNLATFIFSLTEAVMCIAEPIRAQAGRRNAAPDAPVVLMDIRFRHASRYFMQLIADDPRYSEIEAVLDPDRTEVILTDKKTKTRVFYSSSPHRSDILRAQGALAYFASIQVHNTVTGSYSSFWIRLHDIETSPTELSEGAQWNLKSASGLTRTLSVRSISGGELSIEQADQDDSDTASLQWGHQRIES